LFIEHLTDEPGNAEHLFGGDLSHDLPTLFIREGNDDAFAASPLHVDIIGGYGRRRRSGVQ